MGYTPICLCSRCLHLELEYFHILSIIPGVLSNVSLDKATALLMKTFQLHRHPFQVCYISMNSYITRKITLRTLLHLMNVLVLAYCTQVHVGKNFQVVGELMVFCTCKYLLNTCNNGFLLSLLKLCCSTRIAHSAISSLHKEVQH